MFTQPQILMAASAVVLLLLGSVHLLYTFRGNKLYPRDTHLERQMRVVSPVLSNQTTMWQVWIGLSASHSCGAIFFGLVYGYLALAQGEVLFHSRYLILVGLALLGAYIYLARTYWFRLPFLALLLSTTLYLAALLPNFS